MNPPSNYTASYLTTTDEHEGDSYDVEVIKNNPTDARVSVEKKWMNNGKTEEVTTGIPDGAYITGTLKKSYTWQEPSGITVRVYYRTFVNGQMTNEFLHKTYTDVQAGTTFSLWAVDSNGNVPMMGVDANGVAMPNNGASHTFRINNSWDKTVQAYVATVNGSTDIHVNWQYNSGYENGAYYDVDYTQASGGGQSHDETETVGTFRLDASNDWQWVWTDRELDQDHVYTYFFEDVQEHSADGTVVANFDGFQAPEVGQLTQGMDGKWTCTIVNEQENLTTGLELKKVDIADINKENLTSEDYLSGAKFKLEKYLSFNPDTKDDAWNAEHSTENAGQDGVFSFNDLPVGYYKIIETAYPGGYNTTVSDPIIQIRKVPGESRLEVVPVDSSGNEITETDGLTIRIVPNQTTDPTTIVVGNEPGASLPHTGGPGTTTIMLVGGMLVVLAAAILVGRRKPWLANASATTSANGLKNNRTPHSRHNARRRGVR